jgi:hypothetical protein
VQAAFLLEQPDTEAWLTTIFGQQQFQTKTILGKKFASMRPRFRFILMVLCISVFFGMVVSIASFAAMMLGIGMPLGFSVAGVFMLFSSRLGGTAPSIQVPATIPVAKITAMAIPCFLVRLKVFLLKFIFTTWLLRTAGYGR